jgi:hypothetical protein
MAFIAECPFCHTKLQGVPHELAGSSTECPRCHNLFTLSIGAADTPVPLVGPRRVARKRFRPEKAQAKDLKPAPLQPEKAEVATFTPAALHAKETEAIDATPIAEETLPATRRLDSKTAKRKLPRKRSRDPDPLPAPAPQLQKSPEPARRPRTRNTLGVASLVAASLALLTASISPIADLSVPLAGVGVVFALLGLASWLLNNNGIGYASAGMAVSLALLLVAVVRPNWLGLSMEFLDGWEWSSEPQTLILAAGQGSGGRVAIELSQWVDATRGSIEQGDFRLRVKSVILKNSPSEKASKSSGQKILVVVLRVNNVGASRKIEFKSWGEVFAGNVPILKDNLGNSYRSLGVAPLEFAEHARDASLAPGKYIDDAISFEAPPDNFESLRLELPATAIGARGQFRLLIPKSMISSP